MSQEAKNQFYDDAITELKAHAKTSNEEIGLMQIDLAVLKNDVGYIKQDIAEIKPKLESIEGTVQRWIGGLAVIMIVITILMKFL